LTTFIDFRYSRALAAALFAGQEKEESEIVVSAHADNYFVLEIPTVVPETAARVVANDGTTILEIMTCDEVVSIRDIRGDALVSAFAPPAHVNHPRQAGIRISPNAVGIRAGNSTSESTEAWLPENNGPLQDGDSPRPARFVLECAPGVRVMGRGTGRVNRWGELYYHRAEPSGICVELTMDWHHLRAGIPLFGTMTAEHLIAQGKYRLRFRSYAYEADDAEATDFVRMFGCDDSPDIAVHLAPALYDARAKGIPNLAFGVVESENVAPHVIERYNLMDGVLVPTAFARDAFKRSGLTRPIEVVSHGVDTEFFRPPSTPHLLPGGKKFNFLAVGTHVERKNFMHLVRAFLEEFRAGEDVALFLLLRPEYHTTQNNVALEFTEWERKWAKDSAPIYLWTGYLTREHLRDFYANASAYVMPSNEGFGLTLLEAMACGTPVIGLDHGGVRDFLDSSTGYLVEKGRSYEASDIDTLPYVGDRFHQPDIKSLRATMRRVVENETEAQEKATRARRACETEFTWEKVTEQFSGLIERTHESFRSDPGARRPVERTPFAWVLQVEDDEPAKSSLDYIRSVRSQSSRVLCLFTRYARLDDVKRARNHGFVYYRWDGTTENTRVISRGVLGRTWIGLLRPNEKIDGSETDLVRFLGSLPAHIGEVEVTDANGQSEVRFIHLRPTGEPVERVQYDGLRIIRS
jgi:glycosyltransferase involved in cell wall biosynthesis